MLSEGIYKAVDKGVHWAQEEMGRILARFPPNSVSLSLHDIQLARRDVDHRYLLAHGQGALYLVCMGTKELRDFVVDVDLRRAPWKSSPTKSVESEASVWLHPAVHGGFLRRSINIPVESLFLHARKQSLRLVICGHSLGGAVAILCTLRLLSSLHATSADQLTDKGAGLSQVLRCLSFGTPALGNRALRKHVASMGWTSVITSYALSADPVPRLLLRPSDWKALVSMQEDVVDIANQSLPPFASTKRRSPLRALPRFRHVGRFILMDQGTALPGWRVAHRMFAYRAAAEEMVRASLPSLPASPSTTPPVEPGHKPEEATEEESVWMPQVTVSAASARHPLLQSNSSKVWKVLTVDVRGAGLEFVTGAQLELGVGTSVVGKVVAAPGRRRVLEILKSENLITSPNPSHFRPGLLERLLLSTKLVPQRFKVYLLNFKDRKLSPPAQSAQKAHKAKGIVVDSIAIEFLDVPVGRCDHLTISCLTDFSKTVPCSVTMKYKTCWIVPINQDAELRRLIDNSFHFCNQQISESFKRKGVVAVLVNLDLSKRKPNLEDKMNTLRDMVAFTRADDAENRKTSHTPLQTTLTSLRNFPKREARRLATGLPSPEAIFLAIGLEMVDALPANFLREMKKEADDHVMVFLGVYNRNGVDIDALSIARFRRKLSTAFHIDERSIILLDGQEERDQRAIMVALTTANIDSPSHQLYARL